MLVKKGGLPDAAGSDIPSPETQLGFGYNDETIFLRLRAKKNDLNTVHALTGDKYDWDRTRQLVPMSKFATDGRFDYYECSVKPTHRRLKYGFLLEDGEERIWMNEDDFTTQEPQTQTVCSNIRF